MSDTTARAESPPQDPSPVIDAVCQDVRRLVDGQDADLAASFAKILLSKSPAELLAQRSVSELAHSAVGSFRFLQRSSAQRVDVSLSNPEVETVGWYAPVTVVRTNVGERPFIVDTIREFLHTRELTIEHFLYPLLDVERDDDDSLLNVRRASEGEARESLVYCEIGRVNDPDKLSRLEGELTSALQDVVRATDDFGPMIDAVNSVVAELAERSKALEDRSVEIAEIQAFLLWLRDGGFVFLGHRGYELVDGPDGDRCVVVEPGSGLGILRDEGRSRFAAPVPMSSLGEGVRDLVELGPMLIINKTNARSTVHRVARMDYIAIKKLNDEGETLGEHRFVGLFTSRAYSEAAENIPILRVKLAQILEQAGATEGSHDFKEIATIFNSLPKAQLFLATAEQAGRDVRTILNAYHSDDVHVSFRRDEVRRGLAVMVIIPEDRFSAQVRVDIEKALLDVLDGERLSYHLAMGGGGQARLHFYIAAPADRIEEADAQQMERMVAALIRTWSDRLGDGLAEAITADDAAELTTYYSAAFSAEYQAATESDIAVEDVVELEAMKAEGRDVSISFANRGGTAQVAGVMGATELKVYVRAQRLVLSDFMPILEDVGLRVIAANPYEVESDTESATIYVFAVQDHDEQELDVEGRGDLLSETILASWGGDVVSDSLNALVLAAGLHWREVDVLRGYIGYAFQIGAVPSRVSIPSALIQHPGIGKELFELFATKFDSSTAGSKEDRLDACSDIRQAFFASLRSVSALADDRALRRLEALISVTLRTNFYRHGGREPSSRSGGVPYISFKFACRDMEFLKRTRLLYEVWVHSSRMEGVHLRGASVARGGIRWSDRPDDFRTEVLGLVKTQMVKNSVIVPAGSKGGFVTRVVPAEPEERLDEARRQYETLMRGLLDITDNLVEGRPHAPDKVISYDGPDPYLVVAADKGTATFSDVANAISGEYGFWLDDAFASGGSNGYDHKAIGITARGAWECVRRHFYEMGKDIQSEPFTVVGIGDMSGDVFGNGMLLSEQIRLLAAFDHRHVFIDPNPDPASSFAERKRLFEMGRSSWEDYDQGLLSSGGMIVSRASKEVELSPEARKALGIPKDAPEVMDGESLIRAVIQAPAELLWNGGIGTYVKASSETDAETGDSANDAVRVDAPALRCNVVGEGGNLGLTQRARIEYALQGGRINTDALDNSGGVDMSDHEVNLKILLAPAVAAGVLSRDKRNELLEELTEAVAKLVLRNNRSQSLAISLDQRRAREADDDFRDLMFALEKTGELDRRSERLPTTDVLVERSERGQMLVRPELCVLLAYSKLSLMGNLLKSGLPDDPVTESYLLGYFPPAATLAAGSENLESHRLRREIIASHLTNDLVDLMGATFVNRVMRDTGRDAAQVVRAWLVASRLADHRAVLSEMAAERASVNVRVTYRWLLGLARVLERTTRWVLHNVDSDISPARVVDQNIEGLATLRDSFADVVSGEDRTLFEARVLEIQKGGVGEGFSQRLITLRFLDQILEILEIGRETGSSTLDTARAYYHISEAFDLPWLRRSTFAAVGGDQWEQRAAQALAEDLSDAHRRLVVAVFSDSDGKDVSQATDDLLGRKSRDVQRFKAIMDEIKDEDTPGFAAVSVVARELSVLAEG